MADEPTQEPLMTEVEISVAGHTVIVKAPESLADVAAQALGLFQQTAVDARHIPMGFDNAGGQFELAVKASETDGSLLPFEPEEDHAGLGRVDTPHPTAGRLAGDPSPGPRKRRRAVSVARRTWQQDLRSNR